MMSIMIAVPKTYKQMMRILSSLRVHSLIPAISTMKSDLSGYVAFKGNIGIEAIDYLSKDSEFLDFVSRGKLAHPPPELFDLSLYYYTFFKSRGAKCCDKIFLQGYRLNYESNSYELNNIESINRRFSNCFFKGFVKSESDKVSKAKNQNQLKKRKFDN